MALVRNRCPGAMETSAQLARTPRAGFQEVKGTPVLGHKGNQTASPLPYPPPTCASLNYSLWRDCQLLGAKCYGVDDAGPTWFSVKEVTLDSWLEEGPRFFFP